MTGYDSVVRNKAFPDPNVDVLNALILFLNASKRLIKAAAVTCRLGGGGTHVCPCGWPYMNFHNS